MTYVFQSCWPSQGFRCPTPSLPSPKTNDQTMFFFRIYALVSHSTHTLTTFQHFLDWKRPSVSQTPIRLPYVRRCTGQVWNSDPIHANNYKCMASKQAVITFNKFTFNIEGTYNPKATKDQALITCWRPQIATATEQGFNRSLNFPSPRTPGLYAASNTEQKFSVIPNESIRNLDLASVQAGNEYDLLLHF